MVFARNVWRWIGEGDYRRFFGPDGCGGASPLQRVFLDSVVRASPLMHTHTPHTHTWPSALGRCGTAWHGVHACWPRLTA